MRPRAYADLPLSEAPGVDATLDYVVLGWPVIDPLARYRMAQSGKAQPLTQSADEMVQKHLDYFGDEAGMIEASPPHIVARGEAIELPPVLLVQGAADLQLPSGMAEDYVRAYSEAGGVIELGKYPGEPHGFMRNDTPNAGLALAQMQSFVDRQLSRVAVTASA
jgi:acetyl esterase/lipase